MPLDEIAQILVPQLKASGEQVVFENLINFGHVAEEIEKLISYAKFPENNVNRKLEFDHITKKITDSQVFINCLVELSQKSGRYSVWKSYGRTENFISIIEIFFLAIPTLYWQSVGR